MGCDCRGRRAQRAGVRRVSGRRASACWCWRAGPRGRGMHDRRAFPGVQMSPCAYLAGLLHPLVIEELELAAARISMDARGEWPVCSLPRWRERAALGRRCALRSGGAQAGSQRRERLARDVRRDSAVARCAAASGRARLCGLGTRRRARRSKSGWARTLRRGGAVRLVDGGVRGALPARRAAAGGDTWARA